MRDLNLIPNLLVLVSANRLDREDLTLQQQKPALLLGTGVGSCGAGVFPERKQALLLSKFPPRCKKRISVQDRFVTSSLGKAQDHGLVDSGPVEAAHPEIVTRGQP